MSNTLYWQEQFVDRQQDDFYANVFYDSRKNSYSQKAESSFLTTARQKSIFPQFQDYHPKPLEKENNNNNSNGILNHCCRKRSKKSINSSIAEIYHGQTFPFRLWHLVNDPNYNDVCLWSPNGNSLIIPDVYAFTTKVLQKSTDRIFVTTEMKSFVRQLNLYGFHKVQVEKDELYLYLKNKDKSLWPDAVFSNPYFKQGRPELLDNIKRRCRVKEQKKASKKADDLLQEYYNNPNLANFATIKVPLANQFVSNISADHFMPHHIQNMFPQLDQPQQLQQLERKATKRKLEFEHPDEKKPLPSLSPPIVIAPQSLVNNLQMIPPNWSMPSEVNDESSYPNSGSSGRVEKVVTEETSIEWPPGSQPQQQESDIYPMAAFWAALLHSGNKMHFPNNAGPF